MPQKSFLLIAAFLCLVPLAACGTTGNFGFARVSDRECLARAMYFESNRSSAEGMLAVGTVVMNRVGRAGYPRTVCGVVGQKNQFAQGVLSKPMKEKKSLALALHTADLVLRGRRHAAVEDAQFFHTAGLRFPYNNMHYVAVAGGNAFYKKY